MAASNRKRTVKKGKNSRGTTSRQETAGFQTEIILFVILAACVILLVSNFGMGGFVGDAISHFCFGLMGMMAYLFPVIFFVGAAFILINKTNRLAYKKMAAVFVMFLFMCATAQLLTDGYMSGTTLTDYFNLSADYKTGGGLIGGALCISITSAFGTAGGVVIIILAYIVCLIIITQRSLLDFVTMLVIRILDLVKNGRAHYMEGQPERQMRRQVRAQQRKQLREERREEKIRRLEEEIAAEGEEEEDFLDNEEDFLLDPKEAKNMKKAGFLEGTRLTEPKSQKNKKKSGKPRKKAAVSADADEPDNLSDMAEEMDEVQPEENEEFSSAVDFHIQRADALPEVLPDDIENRKENAEDDTESDVEEAEEVPPFQPEKAQRQPSKNPKSSEAEIQNGIVSIQHEISQKEAAEKKEYRFPPLNLLKRGSGKSQGDTDAHLRKTAQKLQEVLHNFGVNVTVTNVSCGPTVTRYELQPEMGVKVSKIVGLADDIKLNLATPDIRIEAPIPGKAAVGIEVPNKENSTVMLRDLLQSEEFQKAKSRLSFAVGKDIAGKSVVTDIASSSDRRCHRLW